MRIANEEDRDGIIQYLSHDVDNCIYLYIDMNTYPVCSENISVWIEQDNDGISLVLMKYYDSFQIYSHKPLECPEQIGQLIEQYHVSMVSGPRQIIEQLAPVCYNYFAEYGEAFQIYNYCKEPVVEGIIRATQDDAEEIAKLLCSDKEFGNNYSEESLAKQLRDRIRMNLGRSYFVRVNGEIVAHTATYAESQEVAVLSGAIVKKEYKKSDFFSNLNDYLTWELEKEGKTMYAFAIKPKMIRWLSYCSRQCAQYGKLVRMKNKSEDDSVCPGMKSTEE